MFAQTPPPPPPPSIVVCILDDVSWEDLEAAETPAIDVLREEGLAFRGFHSMPVCSTTRVSLWTGRLPRRMGIGEGVNHYRVPGPFNPSPPMDLRTLPRILAGEGFATCLVGKWHAGTFAVDGDVVPERSALAVGGFVHWRAGTPANLQAGGGKGYKSWFRVDDGVGRVEKSYVTEAQAKAATDWWQETSGPKLLAVALNTPHPPFHRPPDGWRRSANHGQGRTGRYLAMVESADLVVEKLRRACDDTTWFFLVSDNGTPPGVNGAAGRAKTTTLDRGVRVPLIATGPGIDAKLRGTELDALISCTDLYATLAELAGAPVPESGGGEDSLSFAAAFRQGSGFVGREFVVSERYPSNPSNLGEGDDLMVRTARWKLRVVDGVEAMYDLEEQPREGLPRDPTKLEGAPREAYERLRAHLESLPPRPPLPVRRER